MNLKLLLDSASPDIWKEWLPSGLFSGITTNPTLLHRANQPCTLRNIQQLAKEAEALNCKELHLQAWGTDILDLINCGLSLANLNTSNMKVYVKIPVTPIGIYAGKKLISSNIPVTFTACYEVKQVLISSALNAKYIAPYLGRITDQGRKGLDEIVRMKDILNGLNSECKLLVASLRTVEELCHLSIHGIQDFTINSDLAKELVKSSSTAKAANVFEKDVMSNL